jgi:geranylgeranyl diphosphate synthase type I
MFSAALLRLPCLLDRGVSPERTVESQRVFAETCLRLTEGQYLDMCFEAQMDVDMDAYLWMIRRKTAALIACATHLGALLGGANEQVTAAYARFGENLGLAFQVIDDILGIWGSEYETGKSARTDILTRKKTLPVVYALHDPDLRAIYSQESLEDRDVDRVMSILEMHQAQEYAEGRAQHYSELALEALQETGQTTPAHSAMRDYCLTLLRRSA